MKFADYLVTISGVRIYPLISLLLFVSFFILVTLWVLRTDRNTIAHMEQLPLDVDQKTNLTDEIV